MAHLTLADIRARLLSIHEMAKNQDFEAAHSHEDLLYEEVLRTIAEGGKNAAALAQEALSSKEILFERWCG